MARRSPESAAAVVFVAHGAERVAALLAAVQWESGPGVGEFQAHRCNQVPLAAEVRVAVVVGSGSAEVLGEVL